MTDEVFHERGRVGCHAPPRSAVIFLTTSRVLTVHASIFFLTNMLPVYNNWEDGGDGPMPRPGWAIQWAVLLRYGIVF